MGLETSFECWAMENSKNGVIRLFEIGYVEICELMRVFFSGENAYLQHIWLQELYQARGPWL